MIQLYIRNNIFNEGDRVREFYWQLVDGEHSLSLIRQCLHVTTWACSPLPECELNGWFIVVLSPHSFRRMCLPATSCEHCGYHIVSIILCILLLCHYHSFLSPVEFAHVQLSCVVCACSSVCMIYQLSWQDHSHTKCVSVILHTRRCDVGAWSTIGRIWPQSKVERIDFVLRFQHLWAVLCII